VPGQLVKRLIYNRSQLNSLLAHRCCMLSSMTVHPGERADAEIRRSAMDASRRAESTVAAPELIARYRNPPRDSAFSLEYAYHLLGDVRAKTVLDYGCGGGENALLLASRGAHVTAIDISPELVEIARHRLEINQLAAEFHLISGYDTGLPSASMDVVFCMAILHHLDLQLARREVLRLLRPGGVLIVKEPVRDSRIYGFVRSLIPYSSHDNSEFERPLKTREIDAFTEGLQCEARRRFNLPLVPLARMVSRHLHEPAIKVDRWLLKTVPALAHLANVEVRRLRWMPAECSSGTANEEMSKTASARA
jgi:2-polyprenyl-3-methyl-5-hydroxy-6-metoxy-1,4-benzoquinol methylase